MALAKLKIIDDEGNFEGCGKLGPIRSIFFAEFHHTAGPMIRCQYPASGKEMITKDVFKAFQEFIIPKELKKTTMTVTALDRKISGYPIVLENEKYKRNQFMFNVCFVCFPWSRTVQYEPALIKFSEFLVDLELENEFLYSEKNNDQLQALLEKVFNDLNEKKECSTVVLGYSLNIKVVFNKPDPGPVYDWDVPVLTVDVSSIPKEDWDLTTQQLIPFINGVHQVKKIAAFAGVDSNLVRVAIQNLVYHGVIETVPMFMYSNIYSQTPKFRELRDNPLRDEFMEFIKLDAESPAAEFRDVFRMVASFTHHRTVADICEEFKPETMNIDENRLVQFLVLKKILRRVHKYPVYTPEGSNNPGILGAIADAGGGVQGSASEYYYFFTGKIHFDEICSKLCMSAKKLEDLTENDPNVYILHK